MRIIAYLLIVLFAICLCLLLGSCCYDGKGPVVRNKYYYLEKELGINDPKKLPKGICRYHDSSGHLFEDSCSFYFVGDTLSKGHR